MHWCEYEPGRFTEGITEFYVHKMATEEGLSQDNHKQNFHKLTKTKCTCVIKQSDKMSSATKDCLTTQAPEILLQILRHVPSKDFASLIKTNRAMKKVIATNVKSICNTAIEELFPKTAEIFKAQLVNGWLTPTNPLVTHQEEALIEHKLESCPCCCWNPNYITRFKWEAYQEGDPLPAPTCPTPHTSSLRIHLSLPGPQFLAFLERYDGKIAKCWDYTLGDAKLVKLYGKEEVRAEFEDKVGVHVKNFLRRLDETGEEGGYRATPFERALGEETRGGLEWFYGVEVIGWEVI